MSSDIIEPSPEPRPPDGSSDALNGQGDASEPSPLASSRSGSTDDLGLALGIKPDPLLGEFDPDAPLPPAVADAVVEPETPRSSAELEALEIPRPLPLQPVQQPGSFEAFNPLPDSFAPAVAEAVAEQPPLEVEVGAPCSGSFDDLVCVAMTSDPPAALAAPESPQPPPDTDADAFGGIDLSAPPRTAKTQARKEDEEDDDDDYEDEPRGMSLGVVLLLSYASAVTIGLLYVLITGRTLFKHNEEADAFPPADERVDPGQRAKFSRRLTPPPTIKAENITTLGTSVTVGAVEVTPIKVTSGRIVLRHLVGGSETRREGDDALKLQLRLKNVSNDLVFAPLDEAFLREREAGVTDSYIELTDGQQIELHPLAVTSEWGIVGQGFKELKPGETLDTLVVSTKDALKQMAPEMTWRLRLRTGVEQTDYVGIRFKATDVKPGS